ncbi:bifunctional tRNA pseudouridine(32) synthase/ribosomal large subunit pseudouridine synthase RluA [Terasakiispira papahanaumokuakeensis]|uniref:Pseudouridine synthase n=1 Tax=Terasakiispira papahanaumokuakeensis TaxID=197479 RepID=A0A1E2VCK9_9GAMM|nr:RluA family pseudouridine synthase [Terasakiispira papahanaumokuakeensis]ODC04711.1 bifunctional tRNA pseudouridine(32) synthase/ribosomal large subunit pseudouridine synthase RluA [Terasakiispira papahanaumokuakeensis]
MALASWAYQPPEDRLIPLFEDDDLVVVDKPSGLLSTPGRDPAHHDSVIERVQCYAPEARLVHRLDMDTSGLMVLARHVEAERQLKRLFEQRRVGKRYLACVAGQLSEAEGVMSWPLVCDWPNRPLQKVCYETGKQARTRYQCLRQESDHAYVTLWPETGRSHQLRVHLLTLGHPILGDRFYAPEAIQNAAPRLLLHAEQLALDHPRTGQALQWCSQPPFLPDTE